MDMSGLAIVMIALSAGALGAGAGLIVAFVVLRSREAAATAPGPEPALPPAPPPTQEGVPQTPTDGVAVLDSNVGDTEEDDAIPTTVFRAEDLDIDALIAKAEQLKE